MRLKNYTVIYNPSAFERLVGVLWAGWPNERGAFLVGELPELSDREVYTVTDVYFPEIQYGNRRSWKFDHADLLKAHAWAAKKNKVIIGDAHSHPSKNFHSWSNCQSQTDAKIQSKCGLKLSLIVGCTQTEFDWDTWKIQHAAPLHTSFDHKGNLYSITKWSKHKDSADIWKYQR